MVEVIMIYPIVINASLLIISICAGLCTLFRHTDFPRGMSDDDIEKYRTVAANHSKKVRGCAATTIITGIVFYALVPSLCFIFNVNSVVMSICAVLFAIVQMAAVQLVFSVMSRKLGV